MVDLKDFKSLKEFTLKTLSCSATGSFVDRSFSIHGNIHSKIRNRLKKETVALLMFCRWNIQFKTKSDVRRETSYNSQFSYEAIVRNCYKAVGNISFTNINFVGHFEDGDMG